jgi:hypothetical protein
MIYGEDLHPACRYAVVASQYSPNVFAVDFGHDFARTWKFAKTFN